MNITVAKEQVIHAGIQLLNSGLIARTWGNVSIRIDESTFAITPSGRDYEGLTVDDIVEVKIQDLSYQGNIKPSSEKGIHAEVYKLHPDIHFVIHTHQENASALSAAGLDSMKLSKHYPGLEDKIICAKYALPGTKSLRKNVVEALHRSTSNALILKHHGALCFGEDYEHTFETAHQLEAACSDYVMEKGGAAQATQNHVNQDDKEALDQILSTFHSKRKEGFFIYNTDPDVVHFSRLGIELKPFLDDFAQIVGVQSKTVEYKKDRIEKALKTASAVFIKDMGAICWGKNEKDASAVSMIVRKNCKAYFAALVFKKPRPIKPIECALMRLVYLKKYSTLSEK